MSHFACEVCVAMLPQKPDVVVVFLLASAESEWGGLVNAMSGLLCAHLNAIGPKSTFQPLHSFKPQGVVLGKDLDV